MSDLKLKNCPFCGGRASQPASTSPSDERCGYNFVAYVECSACGVSTRTESNHDKGGWCNESIESAKARAVKKWNSRTQPEATKPAQDLGAAILALPLPQPVGHVEYSVPGEPMTRICAGYSPEQFRQLLKAAAALASPADALVEGDREKLAEVREAVLKYFDDLSARRNGGVAQYHLINRIEEVLGMSWRSGVNHRAAIQAQKDGHG